MPHCRLPLTPCPHCAPPAPATLLPSHVSRAPRTHPPSRSPRADSVSRPSRCRTLDSGARRQRPGPEEAEGSRGAQQGPQRWRCARQLMPHCRLPLAACRMPLCPPRPSRATSALATPLPSRVSPRTHPPPRTTLAPHAPPPRVAHAAAAHHDRTTCRRCCPLHARSRACAFPALLHMRHAEL